MEFNFKVDYVRSYAIISLFFLVLGLSPISRAFSIFSFFEPEFYFIPQYLPYVISALSALFGLYSLKENNSKIFVAAMSSIFKANAAVSIFMMGYFLVNQAIIVVGAATLPEYCVFPGNMACQSAWLSTDDDSLYLSLVSGNNKPIVVTHASCTMDRDQLEPCNSKKCRGFDLQKSGVLVQPGGVIAFTTTCNDEQGKPLTFNRGDHYTGKLILGFHYAGEPSSNIRKLVGSIGAKGG